MAKPPRSVWLRGGALAIGLCTLSACETYYDDAYLSVGAGWYDPYYYSGCPVGPYAVCRSWSGSLCVGGYLYDYGPHPVHVPHYHAHPHHGSYGSGYYAGRRSGGYGYGRGHGGGHSGGHGHGGGRHDDHHDDHGRGHRDGGGPPPVSAGPGDDHRGGGDRGDRDRGRGDRSDQRDNRAGLKQPARMQPVATPSPPPPPPPPSRPVQPGSRPKPPQALPVAPLPRTEPSPPPRSEPSPPPRRQPSPPPRTQPPQRSAPANVERSVRDASSKRRHEP